jgi:DNA-binding NtrC family response regulator
MSILPTLKEATHELIEQAMKRANGNQSLAARFLGLSQPALNRRLSREKNKINS